MVRTSSRLLAQTPLSKTLSEILVCPLSKQPLRVCEETGSLISDAIRVSFPEFGSRFPLSINDTRGIKDGIPQLVPNDGKILDNDDETDAPKPDAADDSSSMNKIS